MNNRTGTAGLFVECENKIRNSVYSERQYDDTDSLCSVYLLTHVREYWIINGETDLNGIHTSTGPNYVYLEIIKHILFTFSPYNYNTYFYFNYAKNTAITLIIFQQMCFS